jgi:hypothetical protein
VKKNQWLRVIELYAVMLVIILVSWKIYSIFCGNKDSADVPSNTNRRHHDEETERLNQQDVEMPRQRVI